MAQFAEDRLDTLEDEVAQSAITEVFPAGKVLLLPATWVFLQ